MLRRELGLMGEVKWSKVSKQRLEDYKQIIDFFFSKSELSFAGVVADQHKLRQADFAEGDQELGFYRLYYAVIAAGMRPYKRYLVLLDFKKNKGSDRYRTLRRKLEHHVKGWAWIDDLTVIDSAQSPLAQLSDLLTGALAASWSGCKEGSAKKALIDYISQKNGCAINQATPALEGKLLVGDAFSR